ncbi:SOS response-associated peptidase family protein [Herbiconiux sp. SALV-R1]|uniref:SOS response-associated peptidase family protein n=1 Tax=unclassified Herbiconiux TaxID=2618217 RepID=UPI00352E080C
MEDHRRQEAALLHSLRLRLPLDRRHLRARESGDDREARFAIITREARDASGEIHDRMPAFLTPDAWDTWLAPGDLAGPAEALDMLKASSEEVASTITTYLVSKTINNVRARPEWNDTTLLEPVELDEKK